jgi:hypothetical protein
MIKAPGLKRGKTLAAPTAPPDTSKEPPAFCFRYLVDGYRIPDCTNEQKVALANTLHSLTQRTWNELIQADRHKRGSEKIGRTSLRFPIPPHITPDVQILAFRFCGMAPMLGYRVGRMLHIICIDPNFRAYQH